MKEHILPFVEDYHKDIRQAAVLAACKVLERTAALANALVKSERLPSGKLGRMHFDSIQGDYSAGTAKIEQ